MSAPATEATSFSSFDDLNADVVAEILFRLPSASVLRCRAVCRAWRDVASGPEFVAAYSRRRPLELVVQRHGDNGVLDAIPLATLDEASRRCLHPGYPSSNSNDPAAAATGTGGDQYSLMGSCGDLLLFERNHRAGAGMGGDRQLWVCNPVTRQWSPVALPHRNGKSLLCGLYLHRPSGEHRLLFLTNDTCRDITGPASHYVGSLELDTYRYRYRRVGGPALAAVYFLMGLTITAQCLDYHGKLHWLHHPEVTETDKILAFDTVSETFRRTMPRPPLLGTKKQYGEMPILSLLEMDGKLAVAATPDLDSSSMRMDLWVLEDYDSDDGESWTCRHRIDLSALSLPPSRLLRHPCCWAMGAHSDDDVILLGDMASLSLLLYHLTEKRVLKRIQVVASNKKSPQTTYMWALVFRDSLDTHAFFHLHTPGISTNSSM